MSEETEVPVDFAMKLIEYDKDVLASFIANLTKREDRKETLQMLDAYQALALRYKKQGGPATNGTARNQDASQHQNNN